MEPAVYVLFYVRRNKFKTSSVYYGMAKELHKEKKKKTPVIKRAKTGTIYPTFEIVSGKARITDPCYDKTTWCSTEIEGLKRGVWNAFVRMSDEGDWGERCADLFVWHSAYIKDEVFGKITRMKKGKDDEFDSILGGMGQILINASIGVDSGQAGVFDSKFFKNDKIAVGVPKTGPSSVCENEPWYSLCCDRTLNGEGWGAIPYGAVSSSGFGDGSYNAYKCLNDRGEVVGIRIVFL